MYGFAEDPWRPISADAPDMYYSCCAHDGLHGFDMVRTLARWSQRAHGCNRTGATTCCQTNLTGIQVCGDTCPTKRSQTPVSERQATRVSLEPHDQAVQSCAGPPTAAMHLLVPAAKSGVSQRAGGSFQEVRAQMELGRATLLLSHCPMRLQRRKVSSLVQRPPSSTR